MSRRDQHACSNTSYSNARPSGSFSVSHVSAVAYEDIEVVEITDLFAGPPIGNGDAAAVRRLFNRTMPQEYRARVLTRR